MHLHLDLLGGLAGDMFIAGLLDAFPEHTDGVIASIAAVPTAPRAQCVLRPFRDAVLQGKRFEVTAVGASDAHVDDGRQDRHAGHHHGDAGEPHPHAGHHGDSGAEPHRHDHVRWSALRAQLMSAPLAEPVRRHAVGIFALLAEAEAAVHGMPVDDVAFHEVGAWDSVADVVGAAHLIAALGDDAAGGASARWTASDVPVGSGRVMTAHGPMPVPAPATALLLRGHTLHDDGIAGERVTPTGAAILRYVCGPAPAASRRPTGRLERTGIGFGSRRLPGISNCVRVLACAEVASPADEDGDAPRHRTLAVVEFEVDDQTPEALALGLDRLRARPGVLDVLQSAVHGKKGRIGAAIRVLVQPERCDEAIAACFGETTTIGLRHHLVDSVALYRATARVEVDGHPVRVKAVQRPAGLTAKAESDDLALHAGQARRAEVAAQAVEAAFAVSGEEVPR